MVIGIVLVVCHRRVLLFEILVGGVGAVLQQQLLIAGYLRNFHEFGSEPVFFFGS